MKKALSFVLSLMLIMLPLSTTFGVWAGATDIFQIGEDYYKTLTEVAEVINASNSAEPVEVKLLGNYALDEKNIEITHPFILDGGNHTLNDTGYLLWFNTAGTITLKNFTLNGTHGFRLFNVASGTTTLIMENLNLNIKTGLLFNLQAKTTSQPSNGANLARGFANTGDNILTFKSCTVTTNNPSGTDPLIVNYSPCNWVVNFEDSTITSTRSGVTNTLNNTVLASNVTTKTTWNFKNSTVTNNRSFVANSGGIFYGVKISDTNTASNVYINADKNSKFVLNSTGTVPTSGNINVCCGAWPTEFNGEEGMTITYGAGNIKKGTQLPHITKVGDDTTGGNFKFFLPDGSFLNQWANVPVNASATGTTTYTLGGVFKIGTNTYTNLLKATKAAKSGDVIELTADWTTTGARANLTSNEGGYTIDGKGHTITNAIGYYFTFTKGVTIKNLKINSNGAQMFSLNPIAANTTWNFENTTFTCNKGLLMAFGHSFVTNSGNGIVNVKDSIWTGSGEEPILMQNLNQTLNLVNSTIIGKSTSVGTDDGSSHAKVLQLGSSGKTHTVNVDATSKLIYQGAAKGFVIYSGNKNNTSVLNIAGSLELQGSAANAQYIYCAGIVNYTDNGAKYVADVTASQNGIILPNVNNGTEKVIGMVANDKLYKAGSLYKDAGATSNVTFAGFYYDTNAIANKTGASIRNQVDEYCPAIRFSAYVDAAFYNALIAIDANAKFGTLIVAAANVEGNNIVAASDKGIANDIKAWGTTDKAGFKMFNTAVYNLKPENYDDEIAATAYFTVNYADGTTATFYANFSKTDNARSLSGVAEVLNGYGQLNANVYNLICGNND